MCDHSVTVHYVMIILHGTIKVTTEHVLCVNIPLSTELSVSVLPADLDRSFNNLKIQLFSLKIYCTFTGPTTIIQQDCEQINADHLLSSHHLSV